MGDQRLGRRLRRQRRDADNPHAALEREGVVAARHQAGEMERQRGGLELNPAPGVPLLREMADLEDSGRGLMLVNAIADAWGWSPAEGQPGKVVWAEMSLLAGPS